MRQAFILVSDDSETSEKIVNLLSTSEVAMIDNELTVLDETEIVRECEAAPAKLLLTLKNTNETVLSETFATLNQIYGGELYFFVLSSQAEYKKLALLQQCRMIGLYDDLVISSDEEQATALLVFIAKNLYD